LLLNVNLAVGVNISHGDTEVTGITVKLQYKLMFPRLTARYVRQNLILI